MTKSSFKLFLGLIFVACAGLTSASLKEGDCEVCINTIEKFSSALDDATKKDPKLIEIEFRKYCKTSKNKENRFVSKVFGSLKDDV